MPKFTLLRPISPESIPNKDEQTVFNCLSTLDDSWHVVWGYYAQQNGEEGDFLILGPQGGLMVLEVKGWNSLAVDHNGNWAGHQNPDNPFIQLDKLWSWVKDHLNSDSLGSLPTLTVIRALAVPNITRNNITNLPAIGPRKGHILTLKELNDFPAAWDAAFKDANPNYYPNQPARERFFITDPGSRFRTNPEEIYQSLLDLDLDRLTRASMDWLDYLEEDYMRYAIRGGPGTGKTWILLRLALRMLRDKREDGSPRKVLLLCYNKPLKKQLELLTQRFFNSEKVKSEEKARIEVLNWECLLEKQLRAAGTYQEPPDKQDAEKLDDYYRKWLPGAIGDLLTSGHDLRSYDALVVDEAQDHTNDALGESMPDGWWTLYRALLNNPEKDPIAVAYDPDQLQTFTRTPFDQDRLKQWLGDSCAHLRLKINLRCTLEIHNFLKSLSGEGTIRFPLPRSEDQCPRGPAVEVIQEEESLTATLNKLVKSWLSSKTYSPDDLLIIESLKNRFSAVLGSKIENVELVDFTYRKSGEIAHVSARSCKGIESRVVVVVGFKAYENLSPQDRHSFCLAASRARVRLVVIQEA
jgi:hypothetical protein